MPDAPVAGSPDAAPPDIAPRDAVPPEAVPPGAAPTAAARGRPRREPGTAARLAAAVLLLGGGVTLTLYAMRLVAATFGCGFSPFAHLGLPESRGWQALLLALVAAACVVLLALVLRETRDELWLGAADGGVLLPADALERLLCEAAGAHPDVVRAEARVRVRGGRPAAAVHVELRPFADARRFEARLAEAARDLLTGVTGVPEVSVRVRCRALAVGRLARRLP